MYTHTMGHHRNIFPEEKMGDEDFGALTKAFTGVGVDERSLIEVLTKLHPKQKQSFREKSSGGIFIEDEHRQFHKWDTAHVHSLRTEFLRFKEAVVLWTMHPWERDARLLREAIVDGPQLDILIEVACTRTSDQLLGARKAYHSLFDHSVEEDIAFKIHGPDKVLLVGLVSAYRYEGPKFNESIAKSEAKIIHNAIKNGSMKLVEEEEIVRILTTRSKTHLQQVSKHYKEISGSYLDEDVGHELLIKMVVQCLYNKEKYFAEVLNSALTSCEEDSARDSMSRVIVTRADEDLKVIKEQYHNKSGVSLSNKIQEVAHGNFRDFLLALIAREE